MRLLILIAATAAIAAAPARAEGPKDGPSEQVLDRIKSAVVRVLADDCADGKQRAASGFVWADHGVVTDLHVVAGCNKLEVNYQGVDNFRATVLRADKDADLALLRPVGAPVVPGLEAADRAPEVNERVEVFGYPLGISRRDTMPLSVSYATKESPSLGQGLSPSARDALNAQGSPSLSIQVLHVDGGNLVPGHSGAPLIDWEGKVLGIGSGGLAGGSAGIGWAVRARYLPDLLTASTSMPPLGAHAADSFAYAMPNRGAEDTVTCGEMTLYRTRQARLGRIAATSDDPDRIEALTNVVGGLPFEALRARPATIWTEKLSGAAIVVPADATLEAGNPFCTVRTQDAGISMVVRLVKLPMRTATVAWDLEKNRLERESFRLIAGVTESGMAFRGHGLVAAPHLVNGAEVWRRLGEATPPDGRIVRLYRSDMAGRGAMVLVAALAHDLKPDSAGATRLAWAESVLAVHLSSFPPRLGEASQQGIEPLPRSYQSISCGDARLSPLDEQAAMPPPRDPRAEAALTQVLGAPPPPVNPAVAWVVPHWGFSIYLPAGLIPQPESGMCVVAARVASVRYLIQLRFQPIAHRDRAKETAAADAFREQLARAAGTALRPLADEAGTRPETGIDTGTKTVLEGTLPSGAHAVAVMADLRPGFAVPCCMQALVGVVDTNAGPGDRAALANAVRDVIASAAPPR